MEMFVIERIHAHRGYRESGHVEEGNPSFSAMAESFKNLELSGNVRCSKISQHFTHAHPLRRSCPRSEPCEGESRLYFVTSSPSSKTHQSRSKMTPNTSLLFLPTVFPCGHPSCLPVLWAPGFWSCQPPMCHAAQEPWKKWTGAQFQKGPH